MYSCKIFLNFNNDALEMKMTDDVPSIICCRDPYHLTKLLKELSPRHIIMYDPSIEFVRQVEIYKANNPERFLRVYFFFYESSVEEQVLIYVHA